MTEHRQCVRYLFLRIQSAWRRLPSDTQVHHKEEFVATLMGFRGKLLLRSYSLMGTRGDCDLLLWHVSDRLETLQALETAIFSTALGGYLEIAHSYLGLTKRSEYEFPELPDAASRTVIRPADARYLFVYPFVKRRAWYALPFVERQEAMQDHVRIGRKYPSIRINTTYSFGLDDQEFVVVFEGDDPGEFLDLVMELRGSPASAYTERDTPVFTCIQMSLYDTLDSLGGAAPEQRAAEGKDEADGFTAVGSIADLPPGGCKRVYLGADAVALFNVGGTLYAIADRCSHGRASLSEGTVDEARNTLQCPWHGGRFDLATGQPTAGPPSAPIKTFQVRVNGEHIFVR